MAQGEKVEHEKKRPIQRWELEPHAHRWFALRVPPQKETVAVEIMDRLSFVALVPKVERERRRRGKILNWRVPVMPGYVLVGFPGDGQIPWWPVMRLDLIRSVIGLHGRPYQIPWRSIHRMLDDEDAVRVGASKYMRIWREYTINDIVRIESGPFYGYEGKVEEVTDTESRVLLDVLGRKVAINIHVGDAVKAA